MARSHSDPLITVMSPHVGPEQCRSAHPQAGFEFITNFVVRCTNLFFALLQVIMTLMIT
jgi:hypothetical protein